MIVQNEKIEVVIYVEDPGAANYLYQLPSVLTQKGIDCCIIADGTAEKFLNERSIDCIPFTSMDSACRILKEHHPALIIVGTSINPDSSGLALIRFANTMNIKTIGAVDTFVSAENRFRGRSDNALAYAPDSLFVPDERTRQAFQKLGYPHSEIKVCGHPQYDNMRCIARDYQTIDANDLKHRLLPNIHENQKVILFASVPKLAAEQNLTDPFSDYTLHGSGKRYSQPEIVIEAFLDAIGTLSPKPYLILRLHPRQAVEDVNGLDRHFNVISSGGKVLDLIHVSDMVAGLPTMLLVEAALLGKPTLAIVTKPPNEILLPTIGSGHTQCVHENKALQDAVFRLLNQEKPSVDPVQGINDLIYGSMEKISTLVVRMIEDNKQ